MEEAKVKLKRKISNRMVHLEDNIADILTKRLKR